MRDYGDLAGLSEQAFINVSGVEVHDHQSAVLADSVDADDGMVEIQILQEAFCQVAYKILALGAVSAADQADLRHGCEYVEVVQRVGKDGDVFTKMILDAVSKTKSALVNSGTGFQKNTLIVMNGAADGFCYSDLFACIFYRIVFKRIVGLCVR